MRNRANLIPFLVVSLAMLAAAQSASIRKDFVGKIAESRVRSVDGHLVDGFRVSVEGPDATFFVYHAPIMNSSICRGMLTKGVVSKFQELGFTKLICTDDGNTTFAFDPVVQAVSPAEARKEFVETVRESTRKELGSNTPLGFNLSAQGPDATYYVHHQTDITSSDCLRMLTKRFLFNLRGRGFVLVSCTDDKNAMFTFPVD
jgi:hypothetical protein